VTSEFSSTKLMLPDLRLISRARAGARLERIGTAARSSADRRPRLHVAHGGQGMGVLGLFNMIAGTAKGGHPRSRRMLSPALIVVKERRSRLGGGDEGTRTPDPLLAKEVLSQLSYIPIGPMLADPGDGGRSWTRTTGLCLIRAVL
jgi:hypothetical protein